MAPTDTAPLWQPSPDRAVATNMARFMEAVEDDWNVVIGDFDDLYRFSIDAPEKFWVSVNDFVGVIAETWGERVLVDGDAMPGARWFPDARLNFAENLLRRRDDADAIVFWGEDSVRRRLSHAELYDTVSRTAQALAELGVTAGDRVAAYMPNMPETIIAMLAAASLGAVWSSSSPDFGVQGVLDRFGQIEPKVLFATDGYFYNGKALDGLEKLEEICARLPSVERVVVVPYIGAAPDIGGIAKAQLFADFIADRPAADIAFVRLPFNHPLYILYSSGTTGVPKCIVHGAGGTLVQHMKEQVLHCDVRPGDRVFYFTTCGWMMWNWLVSMLAAQATLLLYDGAPTYPEPDVLFDLADEEDMTLFGTSAKYIDALAKAGVRPRDSHALSALRVITQTGSPLAAEGFDYIYANVKDDVHFASISGGTDIIGCFVGGNPMAPVWSGEIQTPMLGMAVEVFSEDGRPVVGEKGELVCTKPFPSMPVSFWNDPDGSKYRAAYFDAFEGVWCHGDYVAITEHGGMVVYGRSDATLNPGGVRIGTAEIYRQVEQIDAVQEGLVIGQDWDADTRVVLFVVLKDGAVLDDELQGRIRNRVRTHCSPRHTPARIVQVADIPRTKSGKITELAVRDVVHGRPVKNKEALANPEALAYFENLSALQE